MTACLPATVTFGMTACFQTSLEQAAVLVTQQNAFLMPKGSVIVCLGWRSPFSRHSITYFDSHILRSLDHVRSRRRRRHRYRRRGHRRRRRCCRCGHRSHRYRFLPRVAPH